MLSRESKDAECLRLPALEITVGFIFFVLAVGAIVMTRVNGGIALIWPANVVAAALLIRAPQVRWIVAAAALFTAGVAANVIVAHRGWPISMVFACFNCAEMGLMVYVFRSLLRFPYPYITVEQAVVMVALLAIAIPGLAAIAGGFALNGNYGLSLSQGTLQWWGSHTIGACLMGPPIILWSAKSMRRLTSSRFLTQNLAMLLIVLIGCYLAVRYVRFPFVAIGVLLLMAAFRLGGLGTSLLSALSGFTIAALWSIGVRPAGLEHTPVIASLTELPIIALLATTIPPIAVGMGTDARRIAVRRLNLSERRFREAMAHSPIGMLISDLNGVWDYTNLALQTMLGYSAEEFRALPPGGPSEPEEWTTSATRWQRLLSGEINTYDIERRFRHKDGHWILTHVAVSMLRDDEGKPLHLIAQIESLEARRRVEADLAKERERLTITLQSITDAVITTDGETRITYINAAGEALLGQGLNDLRTRRLDEVMTLTEPGTSRAAANLVGQSILHVKALRREAVCVLHRPDGMACYVKDVISPVLDSHGAVTGLVVVLQNASEEFERTKDINHRARHDVLTGLTNRFEFERRLSEVFERSRQLELPAAVLAIDLDRFKAVNDVGGHAAGDAVLRAVANVLRATVRQSDIIGRPGGDEFAVILPNCPPARSQVIGQKILEALNPLDTIWEQSHYTIGASIGVAMIAPDFKTAADWVAAADRACYQAKDAGRGKIRCEPVAALTSIKIPVG